MFTCPNCRTVLVRRPSSAGVYWSCENCGGRAVGIGLLRRTIDERVVSAAWSAAINEPLPNGRGCPVCERSIKEVSIDVSGRPMAIDVCQRCEFVWFDVAFWAIWRNLDEKPAPGVLPIHVQ